MVEFPRQKDAELYEAVGQFLADHKLSIEPANYAFAYRVLVDPAGPLARSVADLTDGGVRLTAQDIAQLGGPAPTNAAPAGNGDAASSRPSSELIVQADAMIARAEMQVADFSQAVRSIHAETSGFGRDLAASAAAMRQADPVTGTDEVFRLTATMIDRANVAERRMAAAEQEAEALRSALDEARGTARLDPLTELANRRAFDEAYDAVPPGTPIALALCDIDHFKRVNDDFGHAVGDRVLRAVGLTIASESAGAVVARYGGEEFAILFIGVDLDAAVALVDRARSAVAARRFRSRKTDAPIGVITISGGVAAGMSDEPREVLYARADAALYRAKAAGRNRAFSAA
ncbi:sensor domain-containing diguanylate cyclase [Sphingomonas sp. IC4-52]|uniref:GGDEF domain-containing protein n=1 Tax=Sphingomonas sp. IC4-52 TaxID=2887202 RepID=UPI001D10A2D1|nr:GGDEF domain-containing protein [Sphingomonas sp. IC4-52]MCC2980905.1 GGDEF domain-containing protein [Sphingomonas sp. IC4-52]